MTKITKVNIEKCYEPLHEILLDTKDHLGLILAAESGHGKSYTAFQLAKIAMQDPNFTVIICTPSTIWRRRFGNINCIKVGTNTFNPVIIKNDKEVTPNSKVLDKNYCYVFNDWYNGLLESKQHLLLEIKYRNGRRIKHFIAKTLEFIYNMQEAALDLNENYNHHYLIVLEEVQNSFGTYSMNTDDSLELMTIFSQSRSDALIHYIALGQRLNDISTKVIERLRPLIGLTLGDNSLKKVKAQLPKNLRDRVQRLPRRHWIYLDGKKNPEIAIPDYTKQGKITIIKPDPEYGKI